MVLGRFESGLQSDSGLVTGSGYWIGLAAWVGLRSAEWLFTIAWASPGWICPNSDRGVNHSTGIGTTDGVFRDDDGARIHGYSRNGGHTSVLKVELWSIYEGIVLARSLGIESLEVQKDCKQAVNLLEDKTMINSPISLVHSITALRKHTWSTRLSWIPRSANAVADKLAKMAPITVTQTELYAAPPPSLDSLLSADRRGASLQSITPV
ncbi:uncharacterized protein LOC120211034 [Hibiscus syriacus]|uniref:uncharacterized protein LOC120211034 n=1 Tax=Hibiscus syriacus TaxID=106335 RepID=UPI0019204617|nr:uncharacterized protein LOC120211034 [Hibiscus syriacus]